MYVDGAVRWNVDAAYSWLGVNVYVVCLANAVWYRECGTGCVAVINVPNRLMSLRDRLLGEFRVFVFWIVTGFVPETCPVLFCAARVARAADIVDVPAPVSIQ